jgi:hypothetical protein
MPGSLIALIIAQSVGALLFGMNINMRGSMTERIGGALVIALTVGAVLSVFVGGALWMIGFVVGTIFIAKIGLWIVSPAVSVKPRVLAS